MRKSPEVSRAHCAVYRAIKSGLIAQAKSLRCSDCEKQATDYDHYLGYEICNQLNVQPVCRSCHNKREYVRGFRPKNYRFGKIGPRLEGGNFYSTRQSGPRKGELIHQKYA